MLMLTKQFSKPSRAIILKNIVNKSSTRSYKGGIPGCNLPFRKSLDNPMRFTVFYVLAGVLGFGAPWLVVMHQMLRPYDYVVE